jgi:hypothetical protein
VTTYYLIREKRLENTLGGWAQKIENGWLWGDGPGRCTGDPDAWEILKTAEAEDCNALDYSHLLREGSDTGWLSPSGVMYGCYFGEHDDIAYRYLKVEVAELERTHVRCNGAHDENLPFHTRRERLTAEQRNALSRMGYTVEDWD